MKTRPLKFVFARTYGRAEAWSRWKLVRSNRQYRHIQRDGIESRDQALDAILRDMVRQDMRQARRMEGEFVHT